MAALPAWPPTPPLPLPLPFPSPSLPQCPPGWPDRKGKWAYYPEQQRYEWIDADEPVGLSGKSGKCLMDAEEPTGSKDEGGHKRKDGETSLILDIEKDLGAKIPWPLTLTKAETLFRSLGLAETQTWWQRNLGKKEKVVKLKENRFDQAAKLLTSKV